MCVCVCVSDGVCFGRVARQSEAGNKTPGVKMWSRDKRGLPLDNLEHCKVVCIDAIRERPTSSFADNMRNCYSLK